MSNTEAPEAPEAASPWRLPGRQATFLLLFALSVGVILFLRLYRLDAFQREIYGDIDIESKYVKHILAGGWPTKFDLSAGPLYHYLIAPIIRLTGLNYAGLKLASVIVSLAGLAATYAFCRRLLDDYFALLVVFIAGVSSWLLIFSRLGNSQIVLPLLTMLALWLVIRIVQSGRLREVAACALVAGLGLFVLPQSFILPGAIFLTLWCLGRAGHTLPPGWIRTYLLVSGLVLVPFAGIVAADPYNFTAGYVGHKLLPEGGASVPGILLGNTLRALLALHVRGDLTFRSNPYAFPQLDWISGLLFLAGIVFWLSAKDRRRWIPLWLVPLVLLQVPSILVLNQPAEVPSASRTLGVTPLIYMLVACGVWWPVRSLQARGKAPAGIGLAGLLLAGILLLNTQNYFQNYLNGLPYRDTPIGPNIAAYANLLPLTTQVFMVGCCWEATRTPDRYVGYDMIRPYDLHYIEPEDLSCSKLRAWVWPAVFIWSSHEDLPAPDLEACRELLPAQLFIDQGRPIFNAAPLLIHPNPTPVVPWH